MKKLILYGFLLGASNITFNSEKDGEDRRMIALHTGSHSPSHDTIRIGNREIKDAVLLSLQKKDREKLKKITSGGWLDACCGGINDQRIREADIPSIIKIANKSEGAEFKKAIDGAVVEAINVDHKASDFEGRLMCAGLAAFCSGMPLAIGGICIPNKCCCIAAGPVGVFAHVVTFFGIECFSCWHNHYYGERKRYTFGYDKNEMGESNGNNED